MFRSLGLTFLRSLDSIIFRPIPLRPNFLRRAVELNVCLAFSPSGRALLNILWISGQTCCLRPVCLTVEAAAPVRFSNFGHLTARA